MTKDTSKRAHRPDDDAYESGDPLPTEKDGQVLDPSSVPDSERYRALRVIDEVRQLVSDGELGPRSFSGWIQDRAKEQNLVPTESVRTRRLGDVLEDALARMDARAEKREVPITTPWRSFNEQLPGGGFWPGCHVLASGTGTGKSTWALQLALHAAKEQQAAVVYAGLELEDMQVALRLVADVASQANEQQLGWSRLYVGDASPAERERAHTTSSALADLPFYLDDGDLEGWTAERMRLVAQKTRALHPDGPLLIVVDFLQLIAAEKEARMELRERIGKAAYMARAVARSYDATVLLISSVGRDKYAAVSGVDSLITAGVDAVEATKGGGIITERYMRNPDAFIGLGKESGEIEYAADSVTTAIALPRSGSNRQVVFATAKLRAGRPSWCTLDLVNGTRFTDDPSDGARVLEQMKKSRAKDTDEQVADTGKKINGRVRDV